MRWASRVAVTLAALALVVSLCALAATLLASVAIGPDDPRPAAATSEVPSSERRSASNVRPDLASSGGGVPAASVMRCEFPGVAASRLRTRGSTAAGPPSRPPPAARRSGH